MSRFEEEIENWYKVFEHNKNIIRINKQRDKLYEELKKLLPKDKQEIIFRLDENVGEIMATYEDNFYEYGYQDGYLEVCKRCGKFGKSSPRPGTKAIKITKECVGK